MLLLIWVHINLGLSQKAKPNPDGLFLESINSFILSAKHLGYESQGGGEKAVCCTQMFV